MDSISKDAVESEIATQIVTNYSALRDNRALSDVLVIVGGSEFHLHRVVLASASEFFRVASSNGMKEDREGKITLHGVDKNVFTSILDLLYCGKNIVDEQNFFKIWAVADFLQIKMVIPYCQRMMKSKLSAENAVSYLNKVRAFDEDSKRHVLQLICRNITLKAIYFNIKSMHIDEIKYVLTSEETEISENQLVGILLHWVEGQYESTTREHLEEDRYDNDTKDLEIETQESFGDCIAELLECIRFYIISESCLHGTLMQHPLVQGNQKCDALFKKITWYQSQSQVQQSWCPPAAIYRKHNDMLNVLLFGKAEKELETVGRIPIIRLTDMKRDFFYLQNWERVASPVLCYDYKICTIDDKNLLLSNYLYDTLQWRQDSIPCDPDLVRVTCKQFFCYDFQSEKSKLTITEAFNPTRIRQTSSKATSDVKTIVNTKLKGMSIQEVTSIGNTHVVFLSREDLKGYTLFCYNPVHLRYQLHWDQLGSQSRLVTFHHEKEVFVLQENGCLWRMRPVGINSLGIKLTKELVLWNNDISLTGAVLYNDELMVIGKFSDQMADFEVLDISLDGVFKHVRKVKFADDLDNKCPRVSLAVLPKSLCSKKQ